MKGELLQGFPYWGDGKGGDSFPPNGKIFPQ